MRANLLKPASDAVIISVPVVHNIYFGAIWRKCVDPNVTKKESYEDSNNIAIGSSEA